MISAVFVDRPRLAIVIAFVITIAGALALLHDSGGAISRHRAAAGHGHRRVPRRLRGGGRDQRRPAARGAGGRRRPALYMKSTSGNDGSYTLTVSFALGTNPDINTVNVNNRVQTALSQLAAEVQQQGLTVQKKSSAILQFIVLYSANGEQDPLFITNYAIINVLDAISRTPGVGQASLFAKLNYSMRIWFDTQRLTSLNLAPSDVIAAIHAQNVQAPVGRIGARPISDDQQFQFNVQTQGRLTTPEQFGNIVLRANPDGSVLRISDVARVEIGAQNMDSESRIDGRPAVPIGIYLAPGANAVTTAKAVQATLRRCRARFPAGLTYLVQYDSTTFVSDTITEVLKTLGEAFVLVVIVVFLFLGNLRATIIPAVAVPVSLIGAFAVLLVLGYSANTVSLLAMVLAIGIVVDDAIVVVENVERVMEEEPELSPADATKKAMTPDHRADHRDHAGAAVGVRADRLHSRHFRHAVPPVRGDDQRGDADLGVERADAVAGAVRGVPAPHRAAARHHGARAGRHRLGARRLRQRRAPAGAHGRACRCCWSLVFAGGVFGVSLITPTGFLPEEDQGAFFISVQLPDGASVARTSEVTKQVEDLLKQMPQIEHTLSIIGFSLLDGASEPNTAFMVARLKPFADRKAAADSVQALIRQTFARRRADPAGQSCCRSTCRRSSASRPAAASSTSSKRWRDRTRPRSAASCSGLIGAANRDPRLDARVLDLHRDQSVDLSRHRPRQGAGARPQHQRRVHRAAGDARRHLRQQLQSLRPHLAGQHRRARQPTAATFRTSGRSTCATAPAQMVPMRSIASLRDRDGPQVITRYNNYRSVTINGSPAAGVSSGTALAAMTEMSNATLPPGYTFEWTGTAYQEHAGVRPDRHHPRARGAVRLSVPGRRSTKAGPSRFRCCCRSWSACSAPISAS